MQIGSAPTLRHKCRNKWKKEIRFSAVNFLNKNANNLRNYREEQAPQQAEKDTRFVQLSEQNANKLSAYTEEWAPWHAEKETRFSVVDFLNKNASNYILFGRLSVQKCK